MCAVVCSNQTNLLMLLYRNTKYDFPDPSGWSANPESLEGKLGFFDARLRPDSYYGEVVVIDGYLSI